MNERAIVEKVVTAVNKKTGEVFETTFVGTEVELERFQKKFEEDVNSIKKLPEAPVFEELPTFDLEEPIHEEAYEEELPAFDLEEPVLEESYEEEIPTFDLTDDRMFLEDTI